MFGRHRTSKAAKRPRFHRVRLLWRILKIAVVVGCIGFTVGWWYLNHLSRWAEQQFAKSRRWNLPTKVYSDVEFLYPGLDIERRHLKNKLDRLGYRSGAGEVESGAAGKTGKTGAGKVRGPGEYLFGKEGIHVYLHDFDLPLERTAGFPLQIQLTGTVIAALKNLATGEAIATAKLEPEVIATIFDDKM
ncbi:MAG: hypothetical protein HY543_03320, partial [Deltaproteobacteria bacterium]|nr:hypothetical protein [Deltaproteobacteria bacterium]